VVPGDGARPAFRYQLKVHLFRLLTVILAWLLIGAAFLQKPEILTGAQRLMQRGLEILGDDVPPPWGPRFEFVFREIGGVIWLQTPYLSCSCASSCRRSRCCGGPSAAALRAARVTQK
jgi:hypothetical protein